MSDGKNGEADLKKACIAVVTGGTGFIGEHLVRSLVDSNYEVRVYSRRPFQRGFEGVVRKENWFTGELCDPDKLDDALVDADIVFHVAGASYSKPLFSDNLLTINLDGTRHVFSSCLKSGAKTFVYFSSARASHPNSSRYAVSKHAAECLLTSMGKDADRLKTIIIRPPIVYGQGMKGKLNALIRFVQKRWTPALPDSRDRIPMVYVEDLCKSAIEICNDSNPGQNYTITDGVGYTLSSIEDMVCRNVGKTKPSWHLPLFILNLATWVDLLLLSFAKKKNQYWLQGAEGQTQAATVVELKVQGTTLESALPSIMSSLNRNKL